MLKRLLLTLLLLIVPIATAAQLPDFTELVDLASERLLARFAPSASQLALNLA